MGNRATSIASGVLRRLGLEIVRTTPRSRIESAPPRLRKNPLEALVASRTGDSSAFLCPVGEIVMLNGFGFGERSWHPFAAALAEYRNTAAEGYQESVLREFYARWTPEHAASAIAGFSQAPACLSHAPGYGYHFVPWSPRALEDELALVEKYCAADYREHGAPDLRIEADGFKYHGPVSPKLGQIELGRLIQVYSSLASRQYDRRFGDVNVYMLRRRHETRYVCRGGVHRVAAMKSLGKPDIPARLCPPYLVDVAESEGWPQVVSGAWDEESAKRYFDHLFDFDALNWARSMGLESSPSSSRQ